MRLKNQPDQPNQPDKYLTVSRGISRHHTVAPSRLIAMSASNQRDDQQIEGHFDESQQTQEEFFDEPFDTVGYMASALFWIHLSINFIVSISCIIVGYVSFHTEFLSSFEMAVPGIVTSSVLAIMAMVLISNDPWKFQTISVSGVVLLCLLYAILVASINYIISIGITLVAAFFIWTYWRGRSFRGHTGHMLRTLSVCVERNVNLYFVPLIGTVLLYIYIQFAITGWAAVISLLPPQLGKFSYLIALYFYFNIFWTIQVIFGILRSIIALAYQNFFTTTGDPPKGTVGRTIAKVLSRGMDNICVGTLAVLFVSAFYSVLRWSLGFIVMSWSKAQPRAFNYFAFNHVTDRCTFHHSSQQTWDRMNDSGVIQIYSSNAVSNSLFFAKVAISFLSSFVTLLIRMLWFGTSDKDNILMFFKFCVACAVVPTLFFKILDDGNLALLVTLAEEPTKFRMRAPRLFDALMKAFPQVESTLVGQDP